MLSIALRNSLRAKTLVRPLLASPPFTRLMATAVGLPQPQTKAPKMLSATAKPSVATEDTPPVVHFKSQQKTIHPLDAPSATPEYLLPHTVWDEEAVNAVTVTHKPPKKITEHLAYRLVMTMRTGFDIVSGYYFGRLSENGWVIRMTFLETVAGVPGMVGAMVRHLKSLGYMRRDYGWIHTLLEEAENERMHLMVALQMKKPGLIFRSGVLLTQGLLLPVYTCLYLLSPSFCHSFVGYLEEEAVKTYTKWIAEIDAGHLPKFANAPAPPVAIRYWELNENATIRDMLLSVRMDEAHHREDNHQFSAMQHNDDNPFPKGY
uniref:Alternative oxidase n=1 Tax=Chromera velia CCMP2878 TaxID=1169474 RepID=A0A0G4GF82_9ALVE|eukprot:Cvel_21608.t1-p1 / transcript=Cvel_21608.t1 / gene=Cvel_21608 / organism=Chromera_velia_CCMP2878 / gene_product=Alternative oxidase, mitochondrial, putative / transcript_product=Alternative oxidase, mitochondrial, putative / location=Cvel_scaffold2041:3326-6152(+) / protein_length=318 / sequence_SO=supercontig / SO=protein_coding / is_pseudo=false